MSRVLAPCGTATAYKRHRAHGEEACGPCKDAMAVDSYDRTMARERAIKRLIAENRKRYRELLADERSALQAEEAAEWAAEAAAGGRMTP